MNAALVSSFGHPPAWQTIPEPEPLPNELRVIVKAAALSQLVRAHASGRHYSSPKTLPFVAGLDGVGKLEDGRLVYFAFPRPSAGAIAERTVIDKRQYVAIPSALDPAKAAAAANPGMSSWAALTRRAQLKRGEAVLINGATGISGQLAIRIAKHLGAGYVIATGRNREAIAPLGPEGADKTIPLDGSPEDTRLQLQEAMESAGVSVVLDYLWGTPALRILEAIALRDHHSNQPRIRFVQIGSIAGPELSLPAATLRSTGLELLGSGIGSVSREELIVVCGEFLNASLSAKLDVPTRSVPLTEVESTWNQETAGDRIAFISSPRP
jgi:NADPH:quinone reductase-like Zn-dependent oxidoreductase